MARLICAALCMVFLCCGVTALGADVYRVTGGSTTITFNEALLADLGLRLEAVRDTAEPAADMPDAAAFAIDPASTMRIAVEGGRVTLLDGELRHDGGVVFSLGGQDVPFLDFVNVPAPARGEDNFALLDGAADGTVMFDTQFAQRFFDADAQQVSIRWVDLKISQGWADSVDRPDLAGWVIGSYSTTLAVEKTGKMRPTVLEQPAAPVAEPDERGTNLDVSLFALSDFAQQGREGTFPNGESAFAISTTSCNVGNVPVNWFAPMNEDHPSIAQHLYRLRNGRLEMLGLSWVKHGFASTNSPGCGTCISPPLGGSQLGIGCTETYGSGLNGSRTWLGPREEYNPYLGTWECTGSWFSNYQPDCVRRNSGSGLGPLEHRLRVLDEEMTDSSATYYYEGYYVVAGDQNRYNNIAWRTCNPSWTGSAWNVATTGARVEGPLINTWGDSRITLRAPGDGDIIVAVDVTPLGGDVHHYEYAIYNLDSFREVRSLAMDAGASANVRNFAFHDVDHDANNDWSIVYAAGVLTFSTETFAQNPNANSIKYGTLFNFAFDADGPPQLSQKRIGLFRTGSPSLLTGFMTGPPIGPLFDCNMNGIEDAEDIASGTSGDCNMNGIPDECEGGCNNNGVPDVCDIADGTSLDCNMNGTPDECEAECNGNGVPDDCDIANGTSEDCDSSGIPDECELGDNDCNGNGVPDSCELASGAATDCNGNEKIDECESLPDCNGNNLPDLCDLADGTSEDSNANGIPDECEVSPCACGDLAEPRNNLVDLGDFAAFSACFGLGAPSESCPASIWSCADMDQNGAIDLEDYATFSLLFGKQPAGFAPPACMDVP